MEETVQGRSKPSLDDGKKPAPRDPAQATSRRERQPESHAGHQPAAAKLGGILRELDEEPRHIE